MEELEIWKPVVGFEGYEVSNLGRVRSLDRFRKHKGNSKVQVKGKLLKPQKQKNGYLTVCLCRKTKTIHRLVATAFIPNPNNHPCIDHIDTDRTNNNVSNLRWCTVSQNHLNPITRKRMSDSKKGNSYCLNRVLSDETRRKIAKSNSTPIIATNIKTSEILYFESIDEACIKLNCSSGNVSACCRGKRKQTKGFYFSYAS